MTVNLSLPQIFTIIIMSHRSRMISFDFEENDDINASIYS